MDDDGPLRATAVYAGRISYRDAIRHPPPSLAGDSKECGCRLEPPTTLARFRSRRCPHRATHAPFWVTGARLTVLLVGQVFQTPWI